MPSVALLYGLVALLLIGVHLGVAALTLRGSAAQPGALRLARRLLLGSWIASLVLAVADFVASPDYVHMFWSAQIPLVIAFLGSGTLLTTTWRDDGPGGRSAWWFLVVVVTLGVAPLLLLISTSGGPHGGRDVGEPGRRLFEVARWGLGGPLPECLAPITHAEHARGVGHLPREVTVPMGTFLIGAWLWIGFCTLALTGRAIPSALGRRAWLATAPIVVGSMLVLLPERLIHTIRR